ncbi:hypothetical protein CFP56_009097 [Quercus suber]|uniref:Uncharacterized protein n=1 Tax=Quercus suber TaxID=58331 RepID=A0AAW0L3R7_QUESU
MLLLCSTVTVEWKMECKNMNEWCTAEEKYYFDTNSVSMQFLWWSEALVPLSRYSDVEISKIVLTMTAW